MSGEPCVNNPFVARWTAKGSNICLGHWEIAYLGKSLELSPAIRQNDMGTYGIYSHLYPDDEIFAEGAHEDDWIVENSGWLTELFDRQGIPVSEDNMRAFFRAVNLQDWRCGSCGGCI